jgi:hypothetical protein
MVRALLSQRDNIFIEKDTTMKNTRGALKERIEIKAIIKYFFDIRYMANSIKKLILQ